MNLGTHTIVLVEFRLYVTRSVARRGADTNLRKKPTAPTYMYTTIKVRFVYLHLHMAVALRTVTHHAHSVRYDPPMLS